MKTAKSFAAAILALVGAVHLLGQDPINLTVEATMDIYQAGGYNDGSGGIPPVVLSFPARAWRTMTLLAGARARTPWPAACAWPPRCR